MTSTPNNQARAYTVALCEVVDELHHAEVKHPVWPTDTIYALAIMIEEAGEAMKAALDLNAGKGTLDELRTELAQTGAMCLRCLMNLPSDQLQGTLRLKPTGEKYVC